MQQRQAHGIASYTFEYKLSTDTEWTYVTTTNTSSNSCNYTITGLTGNSNYDIRVTVTDRANNSGTGTEAATTERTRVENGEVVDIITDDLKLMGENSKLDTSRMGTKLDIFNKAKRVKVAENYVGTALDVTVNAGLDWYILAEDTEYVYITTAMPSVSFIGMRGVNNGVGVLDVLSMHLTEFDNVETGWVRSLRLSDLVQTRCYNNTGLLDTV